MKNSNTCANKLKPSFSIKDTLTVDHGGWDDQSDPDGILRKAAEKRKRGVTEALTIAQRMKRRMIMRQHKSKIKLGRLRASRKRATLEVLRARAHKAARNILMKKYLKKPPSEATYGERVRVEKILKTKGTLIARVAKKIIPVLRKKEAEKFSKDRTK